MMGMYVFFGYYHKDCINENVIPYLKQQDQTYVRANTNIAPEKRNHSISVKLDKLFSKNGMYFEDDDCYVFDKEALERFKEQINDPECKYVPERLKNFINVNHLDFKGNNDPEKVLIVWVTEDRMRLDIK